MDMVVAIAIVTVIAIGLAFTPRRQRRDCLGDVAIAIGGSAGGNAVTAVREGARVTFRLETRGSGSTSEQWTEVDCELPDKYPLSFYVRRHGRRDRGRIESGTMVDIELGDAAFDAAFLVEAAPVDIARILIGPDVRAWLAAEHVAELTTEELAGGKRVLRLATRQWIEHAPEAVRAIDVCARIASRVRDAYVEAEAAAGGEDIGGPFRPMIDAEPARQRAAQRAAEVEAVKSLRHERIANARMIGWIALVAMIAGLIVLTYVR